MIFNLQMGTEGKKEGRKVGGGAGGGDQSDQ
jgi:hypothetical protein